MVLDYCSIIIICSDHTGRVYFTHLSSIVTPDKQEYRRLFPFLKSVFVMAPKLLNMQSVQDNPPPGGYPKVNDVEA